MIKHFLITIGALAMSACSVFGESGVEIAPYSVLEKEKTFEIREYESLVLVTTPMKPGINNDKDRSFGRLFDYISGENIAAEKIAMTAPVFMKNAGADDTGQKIEMTAPVFMNDGDEPTMSFVLPTSFSIDSAPKPKNENVKLHELKNYKFAAVGFSGFLDDENSRTHEAQLREWLAGKDYHITGTPLMAGYNPPWTLPMFRRNEVLIPVEKK